MKNVRYFKVLILILIALSSACSNKSTSPDGGSNAAAAPSAKDEVASDQKALDAAAATWSKVTTSAVQLPKNRTVYAAGARYLHLESKLKAKYGNSGKIKFKLDSTKIQPKIDEIDQYKAKPLDIILDASASDELKALATKINQGMQISYNKVTSLLIDHERDLFFTHNDHTDKDLLDADIENIITSIAFDFDSPDKVQFEQRVLQHLQTLGLNISDLVYNRKSISAVDPLQIGKQQCHSGTMLYSLLTRKVDFLHEEASDTQHRVIITMPGHVLPGQMVSTGQDTWNLTGIETVYKGKGEKDFGATTTLNIPMRIVDADDYAMLVLFQQHLTNSDDVMNQALARARDLYKIPLQHLEDLIAQQSSDATAGSAAGTVHSIFSFGHADVEDGDFNRAELDHVAVTDQNYQSLPLHGLPVRAGSSGSGESEATGSLGTTALQVAVHGSASFSHNVSDEIEFQDYLYSGDIADARKLKDHGLVLSDYDLNAMVQALFDSISAAQPDQIDLLMPMFDDSVLSKLSAAGDYRLESPDLKSFFVALGFTFSKLSNDKEAQRKMIFVVTYFSIKHDELAKLQQYFENNDTISSDIDTVSTDIAIALELIKSNGQN